MVDSLPDSPAGDGTLLLSRLPGGCGVEIRYFRGHEELVSEAGPVWCGMALRSIEGYYIVCADCHVPS